MRSSIQVRARKFCHSTLTLPSICSRPCNGWDIAQISLYIGGGTRWINNSQDSRGPRRAKVHGVSMLNWSVIRSILPWYIETRYCCSPKPSRKLAVKYRPTIFIVGSRVTVSCQAFIHIASRACTLTSFLYFCAHSHCGLATYLSNIRQFSQEYEAHVLCHQPWDGSSDSCQPAFRCL